MSRRKREVFHIVKIRFATDDQLQPMSIGGPMAGAPVSTRPLGATLVASDERVLTVTFTLAGFSAAKREESSLPHPSRRG